MNNQPKPLTVLAALVIDFFRWSQLTPMILMWAFILGILLALLAIGNQDAIFDLIGRGGQWIASLPWIGPKFVAFLEARSKDSVIGPDLAGMDLKSAALTAWGFISAGFMFLALIAGRIFGPFKPWTLKRKLVWTAVACVLVVFAFLALYFFDRENWNDPLSKVLLTSSAASIVLFIVSAWCLAVSHLLGWISMMVTELQFDTSGQGNSRT